MKNISKKEYDRQFGKDNHKQKNTKSRDFKKKKQDFIRNQYYNDEIIVPEEINLNVKKLIK